MAELHPIPFPQLIRRMFAEIKKRDAIFDLPSRKFYRRESVLDTSVTFCSLKAGTPAGPAAGPQTQMAQNLVLSWLGGGRIMELKTIQILDELKIARPCIDMNNVGYNVEWSQELRLEQSLREYVKAHMLIEMLIAANVLEQKDPLANTETIFDVSVGYDLKGIQSQPVRDWLCAMREAKPLVEKLRQEIPAEFSKCRDLPFETNIARSITLSTFHGCPAEEIESIVEFLLTEMDYHVIIKMNPPMLGREKLEYLLYDCLGYHDLEVNPKVYEVNITLDEAVGVARRLKNTADRLGKTVGVKFTNTLEVINKGKFFSEKITYLSGPPLHVLALALVEEWRKVFGTEMPISFSAGIDQHNFADAVAAGLVPITTCTDLLKPGGYGRLHKYLLSLESKMREVGAANIDEYIMKWGSRKNDIESAIIANTSEVAAKVLANPRYAQSKNKSIPRKIDSHLALFDCINCDKCIPVCPNDANFYYELQPLDVDYVNYRLGKNGVEEIPGGTVHIEKSHQIANFADLCNDCGNCDVFCPEEGGPHIKKPRFFGSKATWQKHANQNGFYLSAEHGVHTLLGRIDDKDYELCIDSSANRLRFHDKVIEVEFELREKPGAIAEELVAKHARALRPSALSHVLDVGNCHRMLALWRGVTDVESINQVNIAIEN